MTRHDPSDLTRGNRQDPKRRSGGKDLASWKPGSESDEAKKVQAKGDFGVPMGSGPSLDRDYVTQNTKRADPGATPPRSGEDDGGDGLRTTGVGGPATGDGASSGGDLDPDIIGVGTGGSGIAASGPDSRIGAAATDGSSDEFASGPHAKGRRNGSRPGDALPGPVVHPADDVSTWMDAQGAAAVTNPAAQGDDSFAGEVSLGEALGEDEPLPPSQGV